MTPFGKSGKPSAPLHGRHLAVEEKAAKQSGTAAQQGASASVAATNQLRDVDPILSFTATELLRNQDAKYVLLWPSDLPHKGR
ncbi:hypothetical protein V3C33_01620 [Micrococcaceae bacterium Sec5.7]